MKRHAPGWRIADPARIIGLMSGTSMDGVDAALVRITESGTKPSFRIEKFIAVPYSRSIRRHLLDLCTSERLSAGAIAQADFLVASLFADAVKKLLRASGRSPGQITAIGSHGQTIAHLPSPRRSRGRHIGATLQIGNPSAIAKLTGITTVGDFRSGDVALGGEGAPLVPLFDFLAFRSGKRSRALLNIGGIANITLLHRGCTRREVVAFDTGPGNMLIDALTAHFFDRPYDRNGSIAGRGKLLPSLLRRMMRHPFLRTTPPKSTGREAFGREYLSTLLREANGARPEDLVTTATEFTALSIGQSYARWIAPLAPIDELLVGGGGTQNNYLMDALRRYFDGVVVTTTATAGVPPEAKEAVCFALLANETLRGRAGNMISVTGADRETILGVVALP